MAVCTAPNSRAHTPPPPHTHRVYVFDFQRLTPAFDRFYRPFAAVKVFDFQQFGKNALHLRLVVCEIVANATILAAFVSVFVFVVRSCLPFARSIIFAASRLHLIYIYNKIVSFVTIMQRVGVFCPLFYILLSLLCKNIPFFTLIS